MARAKRIYTECENELKRFDKICPFFGKNTAQKILVNKTLKKLFKEDKKQKEEQLN